MKVGWIGLGQMGEPFAAQAAKAGNEVLGHSRGGRARGELQAAGGRIAQDLDAVAREAEVLGVCLFDDAQVQSVLIDSGVLRALPSGAVIALHSTGSPKVAEAAAAAAPAGVEVLDATFSGTADDARAGRIRLFVGGDAQALERARPVLETYCSPIFHVGRVGDARRLKLINNLLFAAQVSLSMEALKAIAQMGLPAEAAIEALSLSSGGSYALNVFRGVDVDERAARLAHYLDKDVDAARAAARSEGLDLTLLEAAAARWRLG